MVIVKSTSPQGAGPPGGLADDDDDDDDDADKANEADAIHDEDEGRE